MKLWIVWDGSEDWLFNVIPADNEVDALYKVQDIFGMSHPWTEDDNKDEDGKRFALVYVLEWRDTAVDAIEYYSTHEQHATMIPVYEPKELAKA